MKSAPILDNESSRLAALNEYQILDTLPEQNYDQLTELASSVCNMPIALISLIDEKRQWFKSHLGVTVQETPRDIAFCAHAIHHEQVFEVKNADKDERFHDNPLVTGPTNIKFYAGAPLITPNGLRLGTLCVLNNKPSILTDIQKKQLTIIAQQVVLQLELRKAVQVQDNLLSKSKALAKTLKSKNKELEQFVYAVSHDLKSPLVTINGFTSTLANELSTYTSEKQKHRFKRIIENVTHMGTLLSNLLQLSKIMNTEITKTSLNVTKLIEKNWQRVLPEYKKTEFTLIISEPLHLLWANKTLLSQCIDNIFKNSIRYQSHKRDLQVKVYTKECNTSVSLFICDNGIGIDKSNHERVFHIFEQMNKDANTGTGVGLNIVKAAMEKQNGTVTLISELHKGTCIELCFPKAE
ncbi:GAF domain-containing sensor histidine kinase [Colwellia sp. 1_MG-2023]|uniref:sensor histidine kinase n=1 Tax=unclassified Colwellia TaxID=196834 RepID=UPI001C0966A5|nr:MULTISPECIES: GAF domain-containing sensor histidine kinase [unclassified Colwellia]MBU2924637.1 GAF domain-containing sensor histidine kinase [Colwellia sp. C2M11]MDO6653893.1 GAF domain-containing sensor histidine kinase [Colwellia sp. 3_MG-2023]MDO6666720.1 GAF domain-containing sensor histidine kinase [Colwellia sp. 2_MG-2023]MDO6691161.1 GAF domain-containing sensor histidine kinase [Colwellia sp. 1_MG-2023]